MKVYLLFKIKTFLADNFCHLKSKSVYNEFMSLYSYIYETPQPPPDSHDQRVRRMLIRSIAVLFSLFIFLLSSLLLKNINYNHTSPISAQTSTNQQSTLNQSQHGSGQANGSGQAIQQFNNSTISPSPISNPSDNGRAISVTPSQTPTLLAPNESNSAIPGQVGRPISTKSYTIAIIGDSMVDTMGEVLGYLDLSLKTKYPDTKFLLYNYGTGAQNVEAGLNRFGSHFNYQSRDYPSLPELKPDILIVGSFAYNPFTPNDRDKHWLTLTQLIQSAQSVSSNVYLLAEIAPLRRDFGKGPQGVNWSDDTNYEHSGRIVEQLQNAVGLSKSLNVPLIDAFTPTFNRSTQEGIRSYVNPSDGIHPSVAGHQFIAEKIAEKLELK